jgi:hypothetical protein
MKKGRLARSIERRVARLAMSLPQLWATLAVAVPAIAVLGSLSTVDLAYHVRLGEQMLRSHHLVRSDSLSYTAGGLPWLDQQWLAQVLLALVFRAARWEGLALLRVALVSSTFTFLVLACRAAGIDLRRSAWLCLASFVVGLGSLALRPQLFGLLLFAMSLWLVAGRRAHPRRLWWMAALAAVWANVHGSFFFAPVLLGLAWVEDRRDGDRRSGRTLRLAFLAGAATLVNPFGVRVWDYVLDLTTDPVVRRFAGEWQPPSVRSFFGAIFFLSIAAVAVVLARRDRPVPWLTLLSLGVFAAFGLQAYRGVIWWGLAAAPVLAGLLAADTFPKRKTEPAPAGVHTVLAACVVGVSLITFPFWGKTGADPPARLVSPAPREITDAVRANLAPGDHMFNAQRFGSWFELALPDRPVFVDSRIEAFPASVWSDYVAVSDGREGWQTILDDRQVRVVVADREEQTLLIPLIQRDPAWRLVLDDADGLVFVRN